MDTAAATDWFNVGQAEEEQEVSPSVSEEFEPLHIVTDASEPHFSTAEWRLANGRTARTAASIAFCETATGPFSRLRIALHRARALRAH